MKTNKIIKTENPLKQNSKKELKERKNDPKGKLKKTIKLIKPYKPMDLTYPQSLF